jgi:hypothetical protein
MGKLYQRSQEYVTVRGPGSAILEIGSDRWEGSTLWLADLAERMAMDFYSVDINDSAQRRIAHPRITWYVSEGTHWCRSVLPVLDRKIGLVYLDNFDYDWRVGDDNPMIQQQKAEYLSRGVVMDNQNCQITHMQQMIGILPYTVPGSVAVFDDTYTINECWAGKCGPVVIWLLAQDWTIKVAEDFGVIMVRS